MPETAQCPSPRLFTSVNFSPPAKSTSPGLRRLLGLASTSHEPPWSGPRSRRKSNSTPPPVGFLALRRAGITLQVAKGVVGDRAALHVHHHEARGVAWLGRALGDQVFGKLVVELGDEHLSGGRGC